MSNRHLNRVRKICLALPETSERLSHGEPTFFVGKKVFAMYSDNHHCDKHLAIIIPAPPGIQERLIQAEPETFYRPAYVGGRGWVGIELSRIADGSLQTHLETAWALVATPKIRKLAESEK